MITTYQMKYTKKFTAKFDKNKERKHEGKRDRKQPEKTKTAPLGHSSRIEQLSNYELRTLQHRTALPHQS